MGRYDDTALNSVNEGIMEQLFSSVPSYESVSHGIRVCVQVFWIPSNLDEELNDNSWLYRVRIYNQNDKAVEITERHWESTDSEGYQAQASNVSDTTTIAAGEHYECACFTSLATPSGFMKGYCALRVVGYSQSFTVPIPAFSLDSPFEENQQIH